MAFLRFMRRNITGRLTSSLILMACYLAGIVSGSYSPSSHPWIFYGSMLMYFVVCGLNGWAHAEMANEINVVRAKAEKDVEAAWRRADEYCMAVRTESPLPQRLWPHNGTQEK